MEPLSGDQHPDLLKCLMVTSIALRLPREMHQQALFQRPTSGKPTRLADFLTRCRIHSACHVKGQLNVQKCSEPAAFHILTSTFASRHSGMQFLISQLTRWLRTPRFSEPIVRACGAQKHEKKQSVSRLFYLFAHLDLLSSDSFSSLIFFLLPVSVLTLPTSAFPSVYVVGSSTSKLPWQRGCLLNPSS